MKLNIVPARTGFQWVKLGIQTFLRQPLALMGLFFLYIAVVLLLSQVPVIGLLLGGMLVPAATLGLMAATAQAAAGRFPMPSVLLSAFRAGRERMNAMLVLGLIYAASSLLATTLGSLLAGAPIAPLAAPTPAPGATPAGPEIDAAALIALALHIPLFLAFWHAPALVHWHGVSPIKSLFFSAVACLRNFGAMFLYGFAWMGVFLAAGTVFGLVGAVVGGVGVARAIMLPTALLLAAMFSTSIYFTFRDSFVIPDNTTNPGEPT